ncbi:hypothetical protein A9P82_05870 [Arachidicoccus ginsenosidimutans]|uniref:hypothetical protein n=1 Tax=Arachidicoccus sp. BS20 TaxID=1850526 RepID=UPI0007F12675|nr:hypothetical protein [Arachidicoccus sp. BS20]ANI88858.1 hypothetical protein A9P82_05870 [Arachidicoccus sp. BS20]
MPNISRGFEELKIAAKKLKDFSKSDVTYPGSYPDWDDFLIHLELCWKKTEIGFKDIRNKFQPYQGIYTKKRKEDELLSYLYHSRNYVEHNIHLPLTETIIDEKTVIYTKCVFYNSPVEKDKELIVPLFKAKLKLNAIQDIGIYYNPPKFYLGKILNNGNDPIDVGLRGISFYFNFLNDIDKKFNNNSLSPHLVEFWRQLNINEILKINSNNFLTTKHLE